MNFNSLIFPAPTASYTPVSFLGQLVWIPHVLRPDLSDIPCVFLQHTDGSSKLLLYFHGNAEDAGTSYGLCTTIRSNLKCHVLIVEYPGYGIHAGKPSEQSIRQVCDSLLLYLTRNLEYPASDIILLGRSIGSGPACYLAAKQRFCCLVLISAYTSIKDVVRHVAGRLAGMIVSQRFPNKEEIKKVTCPVFLLHGLKDVLIPKEHSQQLHSLCTSESYLHMPENMDHNEFNHVSDLIEPLKQFMRRLRIDTSPQEHQRNLLLFPQELFRSSASHRSVSPRKGRI